MNILPFKQSDNYSIGVELEFQIIHPKTFNLTHQAQKLLDNTSNISFPFTIKPEIMQSMIEFNSSVHSSTKSLINELKDIQNFLVTQANELNLLFCGGGIHPFQKMLANKVFPTDRFQQFLKRYQYLVHRATVFSLQIHIGCKSPDLALYLVHMMSRYVPQMIALTASSPFYCGLDTGFNSSRLINFNTTFPTYGVMPYITEWKEFSNYFYKMKELGIIETMKDLHWEVRPKPELGTVEIRVCDVPLTFKKISMIVAYIQSLAAYLLENKPVEVKHEIYMLYVYNKFFAMRYGLKGQYIDPYTNQKCWIYEDILKTMDEIAKTSEALGNKSLVDQLHEHVMKKINDAKILRDLFQQTNNLKEVVKLQCELLMKDAI